MSNGKIETVDDAVFGMMSTAADKTKFDFSKQDVMTKMPEGRGIAVSTAVEKEDHRPSVGQRKANKSFDTFMERLQSKRQDLSEFQINKLKEIWVAGGKPIIKIHKMGEKGQSGDKNRAYFDGKRITGDGNKHVDLIGIFPKRLLKNFLAEMSHSLKWTRQEGEETFDWINRRNKLSRRFGSEKRAYGEEVYGETKDGKKYFPGDTRLGTVYSIGEKDGEEIVVDKEGKEYPDKKVPEWDISYDKEGKEIGRSRGTSWATTEYDFVEFDPKTRLGVGGQSLTAEFDAHSVRQDSLWNVLDKPIW